MEDSGDEQEAARQKLGHILISGSQPDSGQGFPLPYIQDVPGLRRGSYPYDYKSEWGRFKYEMEGCDYPIADRLPGEEKRDSVT